MKYRKRIKPVLESFEKRLCLAFTGTLSDLGNGGSLLELVGTIGPDELFNVYTMPTLTVLYGQMMEDFI
jgi:hypothetical protein